MRTLINTYSKPCRKTLEGDEKCTEVAKKAAEAWRSADSETKKKYQDEAEKLKEVYLKEKEEYKANKAQEAKEAAEQQQCQLVGLIRFLH